MEADKALLSRDKKGFVSGAAIGMLGGLIGLGGAEFRLPVLIGIFRLSTLEAVILNKAMSLVVVAASLLFRIKVISFTQLSGHFDIALNLLAGSLLGAWWAAGHAMKMSRAWLNRIIMLLLLALAVVMLSEAAFGVHDGSQALFQDDVLRYAVGVLAGFGIGIVAALLGVAGGELLIPTIVLLYGADIKLAGSLSLLVSFPTMIVGFVRYSNSDAFQIIRQEKSLFRFMAVGSICGAAIGGMLLGIFPTKLMMGLLGGILLISAVKTFKHAK